MKQNCSKYKYNIIYCVFCPVLVCAHRTLQHPAQCTHITPAIYRGRWRTSREVWCVTGTYAVALAWRRSPVHSLCACAQQTLRHEDAGLGGCELCDDTTQDGDTRTDPPTPSDTLHTSHTNTHPATARAMTSRSRSRLPAHHTRPHTEHRAD